MSKKKRKKWSRETKFQRYAAQFWQDIDAAFRVEGIAFEWGRHQEKAREVAEPVLAKCLYDFAEHICSNLRFTFVRDIPDLREKP